MSHRRPSFFFFNNKIHHHFFVFCAFWFNEGGFSRKGETVISEQDLYFKQKLAIPATSGFGGKFPAKATRAAWAAAVCLFPPTHTSEEFHFHSFSTPITIHTNHCPPSSSIPITPSPSFSLPLPLHVISESSTSLALALKWYW